MAISVDLVITKITTRCAGVRGASLFLSLKTVEKFLPFEARSLKLFGLLRDERQIMKKIRVGFITDNYSNRRNIINLSRNVDYIKVDNFHRKIFNFCSYINWRFNKNILNLHDLDHISYFLKDNNEFDVLHLLNEVHFGKTPWISTFETVLPRFTQVSDCHIGHHPSFCNISQSRKVRLALSAMAAPACKKLLAMSQCAADIQYDLLTQFPRFGESIQRKIEVLHPPQKPLISSLYEKEKSERIEFMMVGGTFIRKGGLEVLIALDRIQKEVRNKIHLTIVSAFNRSIDAVKECEEDYRLARQMIDSNKSWISYNPRIENRDVLKLMHRSDVGLLPSYADTYGYSVLEFQASGCPVISTDIRALPEINNQSKGWLISVPKNRLGEAIYTSKSDREVIRRSIIAALESIVHEILSNPGVIRQKADLSLKGIIENHSPRDYVHRLEALYSEARGT